MLLRSHNSGLNFKQCAVFKARVSVGAGVVGGGDAIASGGGVVIGVVAVGFAIGVFIVLAFVSFSRC